MSGGAWKYVAGYMPSTHDMSGFATSELSVYSKYLDLYSANSNINSYNNRILGDATGEMGPFYCYTDRDGRARYHNNWNSDQSHFIESAFPWFHRGGYYGDGNLAGQFYFHRDTGGAYTYIGSRLVLTPQTKN